MYDFSIDDQERHWTTFPAEINASKFFRTILLDSPALNLSVNPITSLVPQTLGITSLEFLRNAQSADFYPNCSFDSTNLPTVSTEENTGRLGLVFVFGFDQDGSIDLESQRFLQELALKQKVR